MTDQMKRAGTHSFQQDGGIVSSVNMDYGFNDDLDQKTPFCMKIVGALLLQLFMVALVFYVHWLTQQYPGVVSCGVSKIRGAYSMGAEWVTDAENGLQKMNDWMKADLNTTEVEEDIQVIKDALTGGDNNEGDQKNIGKDDVKNVQVVDVTTKDVNEKKPIVVKRPEVVKKLEFIKKSKVVKEKNNTDDIQVTKIELDQTDIGKPVEQEETTIHSETEPGFKVYDFVKHSIDMFTENVYEKLSFISGGT